MLARLANARLFTTGSRADKGGSAEESVQEAHTPDRESSPNSNSLLDAEFDKVREMHVSPSQQTAAERVIQAGKRSLVEVEKQVEPLFVPEESEEAMGVSQMDESILRSQNEAPSREPARGVSQDYHTKMSVTQAKWKSASGPVSQSTDSSQSTQTPKPRLRNRIVVSDDEDEDEGEHERGRDIENEKPSDAIKPLRKVSLRPLDFKRYKSPQKPNSASESFSSDTQAIVHDTNDVLAEKDCSSKAVLPETSTADVPQLASTYSKSAETEIPTKALLREVTFRSRLGKSGIEERFIERRQRERKVEQQTHGHNALPEVKELTVQSRRAFEEKRKKDRELANVGTENKLASGLQKNEKPASPAALHHVGAPVRFTSLQPPPQVLPENTPEVTPEPVIRDLEETAEMDSVKTVRANVRQTANGLSVSSAGGQDKTPSPVKKAIKQAENSFMKSTVPETPVTPVNHYDDALEEINDSVGEFGAELKPAEPDLAGEYKALQVQKETLHRKMKELISKLQSLQRAEEDIVQRMVETIETRKVHTESQTSAVGSINASVGTQSIPSPQTETQRVRDDQLEAMRELALQKPPQTTRANKDLPSSLSSPGSPSEDESYVDSQPANITKRLLERAKRPPKRVKRAKDEKRSKRGDKKTEKTRRIKSGAVRRAERSVAANGPGAEPNEPIVLD